MATPSATYIAYESVRVQMPQADGYYDLTIPQAKALHEQLAAILYGSREEPKKIRG